MWKYTTVTVVQYSLVNFQTAHKMTSRPSILTWQSNKKNRLVLLNLCKTGLVFSEPETSNPKAEMFATRALSIVFLTHLNELYLRYVTNGAERTWVRIPVNMVGFQIHVNPGMSRTSSVPSSALGGWAGLGLTSGFSYELINIFSCHLKVISHGTIAYMNYEAC